MSSEGEYLKREILPKDNFMHWKLTIMGDHCCATEPDGQTHPGVFTQCLSTPARCKNISQVMLLLGLPDGVPHSEAEFCL